MAPLVKPDQSDAALLRRFVADRDDSAFAALADRYAGLVYGVALRRVRRELADEAVQNVFAILAKKARRLDASQGLAAWLHKVAVGEAANIARKEQRRKRAMQRYAESLGDQEPAPDADLLPVLDDALLALAGGERQLILMRFFESLSFSEIGQRVGATEEAGRKRVSRALDKLADSVRHRAGRAVPVASLATLLGASLKTEAPAAVIAAATASVPAATSAAATLTIMKTSHIALASTLVLVAAIPIGLQHLRIRHLETRLNSAQPDAGSADSAPLPASRSPSAIGGGSPIRLVPLARVVGDLEQWGQEVAAMRVEKFGQTLADLIGSANYADEMAKAALMLRAIDIDTAIATYDAFKKAQGIKVSENAQLLRPMLTELAKKEGVAGLNRLLAEYPDGFAELSSYLYGWTQVDAEGSLAWVNGLPEDSKLHRDGLAGIYWSVGASGPEFASETFVLLDHETMEPEQLKYAGSLMARALMTEHGVDGVEGWVQNLPTDLRTKAVEWSLTRSDRQPLNEVVPWLAHYVVEPGELAGALGSKVSEWARADADSALEWVAGYTGDASGIWEAVGLGAGADRVQKWFDENSSHPAAEDVGTWLEEHIAVPAPD